MESQLQNLMSYTIFHIGVYISLLGVILGAGIAEKINYNVFRIPFLFYLIAGICGGIIASNIPEQQTFPDFEQQRIGFWRVRIFRYQTWARIEHGAFWVGTLLIAIPFLLWGS